MPTRFTSDDPHIQRLVGEVRAEVWDSVVPTWDVTLNLRPCPFCGGLPVLARTARETRNGIICPLKLKCNECGLLMADRDPVRLRERWNRRCEIDDTDMYEISLLDCDSKNNL